MKRSYALTPLSEDHHHALLIASTMTRASAATARSLAMLFADFTLEHEVRHFALEEAFILPALPQGRANELAERVLADHHYLRDAARQLGTLRETPSVEALTRIGARLRSHVQLEERQVFPCLEDSLDPGALAEIGAKLRAAL